MILFLFYIDLSTCVVVFTKLSIIPTNIIRLRVKISTLYTNFTGHETSVRTSRKKEIGYLILSFETESKGSGSSILNHVLNGREEKGPRY